MIAVGREDVQYQFKTNSYLIVLGFKKNIVIVSRMQLFNIHSHVLKLLYLPCTSKDRLLPFSVWVQCKLWDLCVCFFQFIIYKTIRR